MSAPPGDVTDRLERLAAYAPAGGLDPDAVWARGRRRQRARLGSVLAALVVVGLLGTTVSPLLVERAQRVAPAGGDDRMVLPDVIRQPGGWEPAFDRTPGRLSAVGIGTRSGLWSDRNAFWGVSAMTGESRFLDLPGAVVDSGGEPTLSADGRRVAYWVTGEVSGEPLAPGSSGADDATPVVGVAVLDLQTGKREVWRLDSEHGLWPSGLAWAGDVLWWSAGPVRVSGDGGFASRPRARTWDVTTGERDEPDGPSARVGANAVGAAPDGFVEQPLRGRLTLVTRAAEPRAIRLVLPTGSPGAAGTTDATISPDGSRVAALLMPDASTYDDAPKQVLVADLGDQRAALRRVGDEAAQAVLGWRSPTHLVVAGLDEVEEGRPRRASRAWALDLTTGERAPLVEFAGNTPQVAAEAWTAEVVPAPDAPFAPDPRLVGLGLLGGAWVVWQVLRRRRRGHP